MLIITQHTQLCQNGCWWWWWWMLHMPRTPKCCPCEVAPGASAPLPSSPLLTANDWLYVFNSRPTVMVLHVAMIFVNISGSVLALLSHTHSEWATGAGWYSFPDYRRRWVYEGIPYQVKQRAGDQGITAENMEKSQHSDFNEDTTNESASVACSNVRLWKLDTQKEWRNTSWRLWDEKTENDSAGFVNSKENK